MCGTFIATNEIYHSSLLLRLAQLIADGWQYSVSHP